MMVSGQPHAVATWPPRTEP